MPTPVVQGILISFVFTKCCDSFVVVVGLWTKILWLDLLRPKSITRAHVGHCAGCASKFSNLHVGAEGQWRCRGWRPGGHQDLPRQSLDGQSDIVLRRRVRSVARLPLSCAALPWASSKCWAAATPFGRTTRTSYEPRKKHPLNLEDHLIE